MLLTNAEPSRASSVTPASADGPNRARTGGDVNVVVVTYRCRDTVLRTLAALLAASAGLEVSVTVVDNDSRDGTADAVRERFPAVRVVESGWNSGFAHASNMGIARGTARHVLLLNPDAVPAEDALRTLIAFADARPEAGGVAPRLRNLDGSDQLTARSFPTPSAALLGRRSPLARMFPGNRWTRAYLASRDRSGAAPFRVDWVSGAAMLVPRRVIDEVGGLDERFFLFWEDADWCRRMAAAGYEVWCVPQAEVVHDEGASRGHGWSAPTIRWFHQGAYRYWVKHHAPSPWHPLRWTAAVLLSGRAAVLTAVHGRPRRRRVPPLHDPDVRP